MRRLIGETFDHYQLARLVDTDARGDTAIHNFDGTDLNLIRHVAIQVVDLADVGRHAGVNAQDAMIQYYVELVRAAAQLEHPGLVRLLDFDQVTAGEPAGDYLYLVTDFVAGPSLVQMLADMREAEQWLPLDSAIYVMRQLCDIVAYAQRQTYTLPTQLHEYICFKPLLCTPQSDPVYQPIITNLNIAESSVDYAALGIMRSPVDGSGDDEQTPGHTVLHALSLLLFELTLGQPLSAALSSTQHTLRTQIDTLYVDFPAPLTAILVQTLADDVDGHDGEDIASVADLGVALRNLPDAVLTATVPRAAVNGAVMLADQHTQSWRDVDDPPAILATPQPVPRALDNDIDIDEVFDSIVDSNDDELMADGAESVDELMADGAESVDELIHEPLFRSGTDGLLHQVPEPVGHNGTNGSVGPKLPPSANVIEAKPSDAAVSPVDIARRHLPHANQPSEPVVAEQSAAEPAATDSVVPELATPEPAAPLVSAADSLPVLHVQTLDGSVTEVSVTTKLLRIGRAENNEIVILDPRASRHHAQIEFTDDGCMVFDHQSLNGTFLDEIPIPPATTVPWSPEQEMRIGGHTFRLIEPAAPARKSTASVAAVDDRPEVVSESLEEAVPTARVQTSADERSVSVYIQEQTVAATPGEKLTIPIVLRNQDTEAHELSIVIEGVPGPWARLDTTNVTLQSDAEQAVTLEISPLRMAQSRAGNYNLKVKVTDQADTAQVVTAAVKLTVNQFTEFQCELQPQRVYSGEPMQLIIENRGNRQQTFGLLCWADDNELTIEPPSGELVVEPGRTEEFEIIAYSRRRQWFGARPRHKVTIQVTPQDGAQKFCYAEVTAG